ncbi:hypothetical protein GF362_02770 [Candidatus Dojkabacteria bacterium]|nr:hypothetical protein [Candidatus Dojkabacteria bacterium]
MEQENFLKRLGLPIGLITMLLLSGCDQPTTLSTEDESIRPDPTPRDLNSPFDETVLSSDPPIPWEATISLGDQRGEPLEYYHGCQGVIAESLEDQAYGITAAHCSAVDSRPGNEQKYRSKDYVKFQNNTFLNTHIIHHDDWSKIWYDVAFTQMEMPNAPTVDVSEGNLQPGELVYLAIHNQDRGEEYESKSPKEIKEFITLPDDTCLQFSGSENMLPDDDRLICLAPLPDDVTNLDDVTTTVKLYDQLLEGDISLCETFENSFTTNAFQQGDSGGGLFICNPNCEYLGPAVASNTMYGKNSFCSLTAGMRVKNIDVKNYIKERTQTEEP